MTWIRHHSYPGSHPDRHSRINPTARTWLISDFIHLFSTRAAEIRRVWKGLVEKTVLRCRPTRIRLPPASIPLMSERLRSRTRGYRQWARLLALVSFALTFFGGSHAAFAARVPAPMCTPDAQSMAAPLQRTPTSTAEIKGGSCPSIQDSSWDVLPKQPNVPHDGYQSIGDPLWIGETAARACKATVVSLSLVPNERLDEPGFSGQVFRPPKSSLLC